MASTRTIAVNFNILRKNSMSKLLIALCAFAFAATVCAQGTTPAAPATPATPATPAMKAETPSKSAGADTTKPMKKTTHKKKAKSKKAPAADSSSAPSTDKAAK